MCSASLGHAEGFSCRSQRSLEILLLSAGRSHAELSLHEQLPRASSCCMPSKASSGWDGWSVVPALCTRVIFLPECLMLQGPPGQCLVVASALPVQTLLTEKHVSCLGSLGKRARLGGGHSRQKCEVSCASHWRSLWQSSAPVLEGSKVWA